MMHDETHDPWLEYRKRREAWRAARQARREAWRARRAERRARWAHLADPAFWGLDAASMRGMAMGRGAGMRSGMGPAMEMGAGHSEVAELKAQIQDMTRTIASLSERVIVLEKLATDDDRKLAVEIEKLRGQKE
jgi:hypothetical protein